MSYNNTDLYCQIIGSIMKEPILLQNVPTPIMLDDFAAENVVARSVFYGLNNLVNSGATEVNTSMIEAYLQPYNKLWGYYSHNNGPDFVETCLEKGRPEDFMVFYSKLKKSSLLRDLKDHGYNITPYDYEEVAGTRQELDVIQRFEEATEEDILGYAEKQFEEIRAKHTNVAITQEYIGDGIEDLLSSLKEHSDQGAELCGQMFNSIVRGARFNGFYLRSAGTGTGKTRSSAFDACNIVFPIKYDLDRKSFVLIKNMRPQKTLFVVTEQKPDELKLMVLAYLSGIEERKIRSMALDVNEQERMRIAAKIMKMYSEYFIIEEINDPNLNNVQNTIKKHVLLNDVKYVFYDYIFSSPGLISQFSSSGIREDVALMMMANQLKEIAKTYNIFIMSSTQLNGESFTSGQKHDMRMIRGSKAVADKCDIGCIMTQVDSVDLESVKEYVSQVPIAPTHVMDIYKIRSGRFKGVRIWYYYNMGNGYKKDLFITDQDNNLMEFEPYEIVEPLISTATMLSNAEAERLLRKDETIVV